MLLQTLTVFLAVGTSAASALPGPLRLAATFSRISNELDHMSLGSCSISNATIPLNDTSVYLPAPASNLTLKYIAIGRGTQNYTCASSSASSTPVQIGAAATLFDASCLASKSLNLLHEIPAVVGSTPIGSLAFLAELLSHTTNTTDLILGEHYFNAAGSPVIDFRLSGRRDWIVASKNASVDAPQTSTDADQNVPWLKLDRTSGCGIQEVYRVMTYQGSAPSTCARLNKTLEVQYAAEYWFYG
ncbi:hypothetical protein N7478_010325 [Penicillium angulare]|uniref:uncharacterized protein n=1 Tax=Penicillium angulare TaxID=116970 RepID=UPI002542413D|nr:uncharacterized protein N7478_010325 [Penicillium angulare]KAJ5267517.1 hypothetical protein N7478_010325 [Penicillium angulare]